MQGIGGVVAHISPGEAAIAPGAAQDHRKVEAPGEKPGQLANPEHPEGLLVVVVRIALAQEAQKMLVDEIKIEKAVYVSGRGDIADRIPLVRIAKARQNVPRRGNGQKEQETGQKTKLPPLAPFTRDDEVRKDRGHKKDRSNQPFGKDSNRQGNIHQINTGRATVFKPGQKTVTHQRNKKRQDGFRTKEAG